MFMALFSTVIGIITITRIVILVSRARQILAGTTHLQTLIDHLHVSYFSSMALLEVISAYFLLRKFASAKKTSTEVAPSSGLFSYLMWSTEIRARGTSPHRNNQSDHLFLPDRDSERYHCRKSDRSLCIHTRIFLPHNHVVSSKYSISY
jgi:hypothetical protein